ncbi:MAG: dTDP-4-dehydrorhamnose 3,5-epimerase [Candidatus Omnitrophica bacterium]|jgi:dTDP-4-dehydrorhamnose 3,5-epimerase|nr:dTDP-4-dehydrorhamnose 3,5-epimerase [Candidatus Omnitrophota bacterium]
MKFVQTNLKGVFIIGLEKKEDSRGFFARIFCQKEFREHGLIFSIAQCSLSLNKNKGIIRGIHYDKKPHEQAKLVICIAGAIYDVVVDLRSNSATFKKWFAVKINGKNPKAIYVPKGCAHGYQTLTGDVKIFYQMSDFYFPEYYSGIRWDDPAFKIKWPLSPTLISKQDLEWQDFND